MLPLRGSVTTSAGEVVPQPRVLKFRRMPLLKGDAGVAQTIHYMGQLCDGTEGADNPWIRYTAVKIVRNTRNRDVRGELGAVLTWVKRNIAFRGEKDETVQTPLVTLQLRAGDCDDHSVLICALLKSLGYQTRFVTVAADRGTNEYSHVLPEVMDPATNRWTSMESTVDVAYPGWKPPAGVVHRRAEWNSGSRGPYREGSRGMGRLAAQGDAPPASNIQVTQLPYPPKGGCSGSASTGTTGALAKAGGVTASVAGTASTIMALSPTAGPFAPFVALGAGLVALFSGLFGGAHAKAVQQESQILCAAVPAANQALQQIASQVQSGAITPSQGSQLLDQLMQQFSQALAPLKQQSGCGAGLAVGQTCPKGNCNGGCLYKAWLGTIVQQMKAQFSAMPQGGGAASVSASLSNKYAGIPLWGWLTGAAALGLAVL